MQIASQRNRIYADFRKVQSTGNRTKMVQLLVGKQIFPFRTQ
ncbi:hypothetical protein EMIT036CA2_10639 [Chryseobacterium sp. IT-36CA2]